MVQGAEPPPTAVPDASFEPPSEEPAGELVVVLVLGEEASWLEVFEDQEKAFTGIVLSGVRLTFRAESEIKVKAGNAGTVSVRVNDQEKGLLGETGKVVEKTFLLE